MKNTKAEIKDNELENVTGGKAPELPEAHIVGKVPEIEPVIIKPEYDEKDTFVPIPY